MPRSCTNLRTSLENINNSVLACEIINKNINKVGKPWEQLREQGGNKSGDCII